MIMKLWLQNNIKSGLMVLLIGIPIANFFSGLLALLVYGVDVPIFDEWRNYQNQQGAFYYVFKPVNDTYSPFGFFLEGMAQKYLAGNGVAHRLLSMLIMLGSFLLVQWKLLGLVFRDNLLRATVFSFSIFMLQSMSYWGIESVNAYVQGIPLLACCWMIYTLLANDPTRFSFSLILISLGFISGLSYISGAFVLIPFWLSCLIFKRIFAYDSTLVFRFKQAAKALTIPMLVTVSIQLHALWVFGGNHTGSVSSIFSMNFWMLILGKIARSLALVPEYISLLVSLGLLIFVVGLSIVAFFVSSIKTNNQNKQHAIIIFIQLFFIIGCYLIMVGGARGTFGVHAGMTPLDMFKFGLTRHHFFWVTILWPWVVAFCLIFLGISEKLFNGKKSMLVWSILCLIATIFVTQLASFQHQLFFRYLRSIRMPVYSCLQNIYQDKSAIGCEPFFVYPPDPEGSKQFIEKMIAELNVAKSLGGTFFDFVSQPKEAGILPFSSEKIIFSSDNDFKQNMQWYATDLVQRDEGVSVQPKEINRDSYVEIAFDKEKVKSCQKLQLSVKQESDQSNFGQLFYLPQARTEFTEQDSKTVNVLKGKNIMTFIIESETGFEPFIRFNPIGNRQSATLYKIEAYCLVAKSSA